MNSIRLFSLLLAALPGASLLAQIVFSPYGTPLNTNLLINSDQFTGARFEILETSTITTVTVGLGGTNAGSFFVALVPLGSASALPVGNPSSGVPFNPGEVAAFATATVDAGFVGDYSFVTGFSVTPGVYGVIFGTGLYGTTGLAGAPNYNSETGSSQFFWSGDPLHPETYRWEDYSSSEHMAHRIGITVTAIPESSSCALLPGLFVVAFAARSRRKSKATNQAGVVDRQAKGGVAGHHLLK